MKKSFLYMALLSVGVLLQACLDFDDPGSELTTGQTVVGGDEEPSGVLTPSCYINYLDYERDIDFETATQAYETLDAAGYFGYSTSAQYSLRSGKENGTPSSHQYQYNCALNIDNYAGYLVVTHYDFPYANASQTSTYDMHETFNGGARGCYDNAKNILLDLLTRAELNDLPEIKAVNLIYYSLAAQEVADISGPFTYLEDKLKLQNPSTYDPLEIIYDSIVADLDKAVACLKYGAANRSEEYKAMLLAQFGQYPSATEAVRGNTDSFLESVWRLANSIKLRMAMHLVKVDADKARRWAEEAVASGVCESTEMQHALYPAVSGFTHPLVEICNSWGDNRLNASFESILCSLNHPYVTGKTVDGEWRPYLWRKNSDVITNKHYQAPAYANNTDVEKSIAADTRVTGIRAGAYVGEGQSYANNQYVAASTINTDVMSNAPMYLVKWAEVDFLRAEGALRGWNMGGTAEAFYNRGIENAYLNEPTDFEWYDLFGQEELKYADYLEDYMAQETAADYTQVDPFGDGADKKSRTTIGVKWNGSLDQETLLEMIITQKYIALFPESREAWTDLRRTGYPKIFPVMNPGDGDGSLHDGDLIRRMPWASTDPQTSANIQATGLKALGGDDLQSTRLWWDVDAPNF